MLGVDSAASMMRYSLTSLDSDKPINLRVDQDRRLYSALPEPGEMAIRRLIGLSESSESANSASSRPPNPRPA